MADEYIKREDALTELDEIGFCDDEPIQTRNSALKIIQKIPAADVRPVVRGRWVATVGKKSRICSACGHDEPYKFADNDVDIFNYCPNCGADMREVQHDD